VATDTRDRILSISQTLFNNEGLASVSTHRIAAEAEISPGNLHYHFRTKELIVTRLLRRFEARVTPCIEAHASAKALDDLWLALHLTFEAIDAYRFIYRDVDHLLNGYPALDAEVRSLTARNLVAARNMVAGLNQAGAIHASAEDVEMLALQLVFTMSCWYSFKRITPTRLSSCDEPALAAYYTLSLLSPYVSDESRPYLDYLRAKYLK
jgi:AcrR family transcriptional regulator